MTDLEHREEAEVVDKPARWWERALVFGFKPTSTLELAAYVAGAGAAIGWVAGWLSNGEFLGGLVAALGFWELARFLRKVL